MKCDWRNMRNLKWKRCVIESKQFLKKWVRHESKMAEFKYKLTWRTDGISDNFQLIDFSPNSCSYRGSYFKYSCKGSQTFWIRFGGAVGQGVVLGPRCRLMCVWVFSDFDSVLGGGGVGQVLSDVCVGEGSQILIRFGGLAPRFAKVC